MVVGREAGSSLLINQPFIQIGTLKRSQTVPLCPSTASPRNLPSSSHLNSAIMSHSNSSSSSSNFQLVITNALKEYEKRTKQDLLAHPLASQLQVCDSPTAILNVLQQQIQGVDQRHGDDRWTKWLDPTVNILYTLCDTLGEGVGLVSVKDVKYVRGHILIYMK